MMKLVRLLPSLLLIIIITACAARHSQVEMLAFPADQNQPFLTLKNTLGKDLEQSRGFFKRLMLKITGPETVLFPLRPVAVAVSETGDVYVVDADAACVLRYQFNSSELEDVNRFGDGVIKAPQGIAISNDLIYVSDAQTGLIHRFDTDLKSLEPLKVESLVRPGQLSINPHTAELFIVDAASHQILVVDAQGSIKTKINSTEIKRLKLKAPTAVAFSSEGNIVILDGMTRRVEILSPQYEYLSGFGDYDQVPGSFSYPRGLTISSDGYIFVSDASFGNVQIFDPAGALLYYFGETGAEPGEFLLPSALLFDAQDNLYVVDQYNSRVQVFQYDAQER